MVTGALNTESDENLLLLNFTTRLLTAFTNRETLVDIALECFADFAHSRRAGILAFNSNPDSLHFDRVFADKKVLPVKGDVELDGSPLAEVLLNKVAAVYPLAPGTPLPLPSYAPLEGTGKCLCLPVVAADLRPVGVVTIEINDDQDRRTAVMQHLRMLTTVLAVSLENARLFGQVLKDGLTGVYVRQYGEARLTEELARIKRYPGSVALVFLDIDNFKSINDVLGHQTGDRVLKEVSQIIQACLRQDIDLLCRYGGDEFIIIVPNTEMEEAQGIAERIRLECVKHFSTDSLGGVSVSVSAGVSTAAHGTPLSAEELLRRADFMLYRAKEAGRNRVRVWMEE